MTMKELYEHFNRKVYSTLNLYTDPEGYRTRSKVYDEIKTVEEKPNPDRRRKNYPLRTLEYNDFRFVETINTAAGDRGSIYHIPTGELVATDARFYDFHVFVWWFYNCR